MKQEILSPISASHVCQMNSKPMDFCEQKQTHFKRLENTSSPLVSPPFSAKFHGLKWRLLNSRLVCSLFGVEGNDEVFLLSNRNSRNMEIWFKTKRNQAIKARIRNISGVFKCTGRFLYVDIESLKRIIV